ncbi:transposase IS4 family protein [Dietzia sp. DQ12-45-1b]|nr:transposase IS4 family protein [Dietzia sp. DQ12-45-1b]
MGYSVGFQVTGPLRRAIATAPEAAWGTGVEPVRLYPRWGRGAELTGFLAPGLLRKWPDGMRVIVRRERPHPGAQPSMFEEIDGWRYQAFVTNTAPGQLQFLEALHWAHARVEDRIRHARDTGLGRLPSRDFAFNQAWLVAVMLRADLVSWTRRLACIDDAAVLASCEPKALRYRVLHVGARLVRSGRRRRVKTPETWPWATVIVAVFNTIAAIPKPA